MNTPIRNSSVQAAIVPRRHDRLAVALPATVVSAGHEYSARILNLALGGALIECSAPFAAGASFLLRCGSIATESVVVWQNGGQYGVNFSLPLSDEQVAEQLSRNTAIISRQRLKAQPTAAANDGPTTRVGQRPHDPADDRTSTDYLSALEASHIQLQSHTSRLEAMLASDLADMATLSGVRLELRQANVRRTQVALDACRHLMKVAPAQASLQDLQREELNVSQMISQQVQCWTVQALRSDWGSYCLATKSVIQRVRELIATEKQVLEPLLKTNLPCSSAGSKPRPSLFENEGR